jgi:hypothetical protein
MPSARQLFRTVTPGAFIGAGRSIDSALRRIETGEYGFCEVSGEPISLARLEARPIATSTRPAIAARA